MGSGKKEADVLIHNFSPLLKKVMGKDEFKKLTSKGMLKSDSIEKILPELWATRGVAQHQTHKYDVYDHTMAVVEGLAKIIENPSFLEPKHQSYVRKALAEEIDGIEKRDLLLFSALLHDIGKGVDVAEKDDSTSGHGTVGAELVPSITERIGFTEKQTEYIQILIRFHKPKYRIKRGQSLKDYLASGNLDRRYNEISEIGCVIELALLSFADFLGKKAEETKPREPDIETIAKTLIEWSAR